MLQRIAYGALAIGIVLGIVGGDARIAREAVGRSELLAYGSLIPCVLTLLGAAGAFELSSMLRKTGACVYRNWALVCVAVLGLAPWFSAGGVFGEGPYERAGFHLEVELAALAMLGTGIVAVLRRDVSRGLVNVAATWLVIGYCGVLVGFLTLLRCDGHKAGDAGAWILLCVVLVCKVSDIGAYFVGSLLGRHKLIPEVSPGKSVEGLFGGVAASVLVSALFWWMHNVLLTDGEGVVEDTPATRLALLGYSSTVLYHHISMAQAIIFGAVMSITGQLGDLVESVFKRSAQTKDSGNILPRFGGVLDMLDSPLAIAPVAWFMLTRVWSAL